MIQNQLRTFDIKKAAPKGCLENDIIKCAMNLVTTNCPEDID